MKSSWFSLATLVLCAAGFFAVPANADIDSALGGMIGANIHVNNPGMLSTARRGGVYAGSVYIRGNITDVAVLNFTPPSFSSGCGGVDLFGGSFSFINAEQFTQLLRSIAQNAAGYAFELALKNICEQCATIVSGLQKSIQALNELSSNSCQLAQGIVNTGISALELKDVKGIQGDNIQNGWKDSFEAFWGGLKQSVTALNTNTPSGNEYQDKYEINVVWQAMRDSSYSGWFTTGADNTLLETLMSLVGTVVVVGPTDDENGNSSRTIAEKTVGARVTVRDMFYGNPSAKLIRCNETTKCLNMSETTGAINGIVKILGDQYVGTGPNDTSTVLYKLVRGTPAEQTASADQFIGTFGTFGSQLIQIIKNEPAGSFLGYQYFDTFKETIAFELTVAFISEALATLDETIKTSDFRTAHAENWRDVQFPQAKKRINDEIAELSKGVRSPGEFQGLFMQWDQYNIAKHRFSN